MSTLIALICMTDHYSGGLLSRDMKGCQALLGWKDIDPNRLIANDGTLLGSATMNGHDQALQARTSDSCQDGYKCSSSRPAC